MVFGRVPPASDGKEAWPAAHGCKAAGETFVMLRARSPSPIGSIGCKAAFGYRPAAQAKTA